MNLKYEYDVEVPVETWQKYADNDDLETLVESCAWKAIGVAKRKGFTFRIQDVGIEIVPMFHDEDRLYETVRVTIKFDKEWTDDDKPVL